MALRLLTRRLRLLTHKDKKYIYESPDGGKTLTRRLIGDTNKEILSKSVDIDISDVILIEHVKNIKSKQADLFEEDLFTDFEGWEILPNLHDPQVKRLLGTDVLQQLKKALGE